MKQRRMVPAAVALIVTLAVSACGSGAGADRASADTAPKNKATGAPLPIGFINQENTPAGSFPEVREAAEAAVNYINDDLGGVNGRPLELVSCVTDASPASGANCARQLVDQKVPLVSGGEDFATSGSIPVLEKAKVPYVGGIPILPPELSSDASWQFTGGSVGAFPAQAVYIAKELKAEKVGIIYTANPAGEAAATKFGKDILNKLGVQDVTLVGAAADAADFTGPVAQVTKGNPDAVMVLFAAQGCSRIMAAKQSIGVTAKMFYPGSCADESVIKGGGAGAAGAYFNSEPLLFTSDEPEVKTWRDQMTRYSPKTTLSAYSQAGFQTVMNIQATLKKISGEITPEAVVQTLASAKDEPNFMAHPYTCDRQQVQGAPAVCNATNRIIQYDGGKFVDVLGEWVDGTEYLG